MLIMANQYATQREDAKKVYSKRKSADWLACLELRSGIMPNLANIKSTEDQSKKLFVQYCD